MTRYAELEAARRAGIGLCQRRLRTLDTRFEDGLETPDDYRHRRAPLAAKLDTLCTQVIAQDSLRLDVARFLEASCHPAALYEQATPVDQHLLLTLLIDGLWYDLDTRQITRVRWQPWVERFLTV